MSNEGVFGTRAGTTRGGESPDPVTFVCGIVQAEGFKNEPDGFHLLSLRSYSP